MLPFKSSSKKTEFYERYVVYFLICFVPIYLFRWLKSPAFGTWLAQQEQIVQAVLNDPLPSAVPDFVSGAGTVTGQTSYDRSFT